MAEFNVLDPTDGIALVVEVALRTAAPYLYPDDGWVGSEGDMTRWIVTLLADRVEPKGVTT